MQKADEMRVKLINEFTENYMGKLFYFCLKKTGNHAEAEDLTQDIALQIFSALNKGTIPINFSAWVWQIARNRYSVWAKQKHERNESVTGSDIGDFELQDNHANVLDEMIRTEQMALLRRELAFIKSDYRNIVVAYYFENRTVREIALSFSIPVNTVKSKLLRARDILKEGMEMAREFGKRSYNPEQIAFVMNGKDGEHGQPWSVITHLLYKNIFLETYENPQTAEELSLELGIALPYMEDELEYLVREQLLRKEGNRYQTDFRIVSRQEQRAVFDANKGIQKPLTEKLCAFIDAYMQEETTKVNVRYVGYEVAKWALLIRVFDWMKYSCKKRAGIAMEESHPKRPLGGAWTLTGYETIDWQKPPFVGLHGYLSHDENGEKFYINFGQCKFYYKNIQEKSPLHLSWNEVHTLWLVCNGKTEECEAGYLEKMLAYGYLKRENGVILPNVVVFENYEELTGRLSKMRDEIFDLILQAPDIERGYVVEQALENGWLTYREDMPKTIGAYIDR